MRRRLGMAMYLKNNPLSDEQKAALQEKAAALKDKVASFKETGVTDEMRARAEEAKAAWQERMTKLGFDGAKWPGMKMGFGRKRRIMFGGR